MNETSCNVTLQNDQQSTRSQVSPRAPPKSYNVNIYRKSCVICGHLKHKGDYEKFRISEEKRAKKFLKAAVFFQDEVYVRTCDLQDVYFVLGADLFCHKKMYQKLPSKYDRQTDKEKDSPSVSKRVEAFQNIVSELHAALKRGEGFPLSSLRDRANELMNLENFFSNRELKVLF